MFQPFATGTAILVAAIITAAMVGLEPRRVGHAMVTTWRQARIAVLTVALIIGLAYLMNYSGLSYTLGLGAASAGVLFPLLSPFLGWIAVFLSGSDTSGNALFGNLQVVAANQLQLNPVLIAGHQLVRRRDGKDDLAAEHRHRRRGHRPSRGQEGVVFARTFKHSIFLTLMLGVLVVLQQYVFAWMIP